MAELIWSDALALDMPEMDDTHREFVALLTQVADAADSGILAAWEALVDHTADHFGREDSWMQQTGFASENCHATQHGVVLSVMCEGLAVARGGQLDVIRRLAHELARWFPQHAQSMDAALALHLRSAGFDFTTGRSSSVASSAPITGCGSSHCSPTTAVPAG